MALPSAGADAIPEGQTQNQTKKRFRLITVGKKQLLKRGSKGWNRLFWASILTVEEDLEGAEEEDKDQGLVRICCTYRMIADSVFRVKVLGTMKQIALGLSSLPPRRFGRSPQ